MKITNEQLKQIIKEELEKVLDEGIPSLVGGYLAAKAAKNIQNRDRRGTGDLDQGRGRIQSATEINAQAARMKKIKAYAVQIAEMLKGKGLNVESDVFGYVYFYGVKEKGWFTSRKPENRKAFMPNPDVSVEEAAQQMIDSLRSYDPGYFHGKNI